MEIFWLIAVPLTLVVAYIVTRPIIKSPPPRVSDNEELRVSIYRENLQEIEAEFTSGQVDPAQVQNVKNELELSLLRETNDNHNEVDGSRLQGPPRSSLPGIFTAIVLIGVSLMLYLVIGNPQLISLQGLGDINSEETWNNNPDREQMVNLMEAHLQRNPDDANGLYFLANVYLADSDYEKAVTAFERLYQLTGENIQVMLAYADTLVRVNNGSFAGRASELIEKVLALEPGNYTALLFSGLAAEEKGNYQAANDYYSRLLPALQNQPEMLQTINMLIANNRVMMGQDGSPDSTIPDDIDASADPAKSIQVEVSVSPELLDEVEPGAVLFIYAQATDGSPMPLAVVRARANELPMTVTLDDSLAMMPARRLSNFDVVRIQARISKSGAAEPASGDMLGKLDQVSVAGSDSVELVINQIIP